MMSPWSQTDKNRAILPGAIDCECYNENKFLVHLHSQILVQLPVVEGPLNIPVRYVAGVYVQIARLFPVMCVKDGHTLIVVMCRWWCIMIP